MIAHATSADLERWQVRPPLSAPGAGFIHLEVPQIATIEGRTVLLFSCDGPALVGERAGTRGGIWALSVDSANGPYDVAASTLVATDELYSGRVIQDRSGRWVMLAFENSTAGGDFVGSLSDPIPVRWFGDGSIALINRQGELA